MSQPVNPWLCDCTLEDAETLLFEMSIESLLLWPGGLKRFQGATSHYVAVLYLSKRREIPLARSGGSR